MSAKFIFTSHASKRLSKRFGNITKKEAVSELSECSTSEIYVLKQQQSYLNASVEKRKVIRFFKNNKIYLICEKKADTLNIPTYKVITTFDINEERPSFRTNDFKREAFIAAQELLAADNLTHKDKDRIEKEKYLNGDMDKNKKKKLTKKGKELNKKNNQEEKQLENARLGLRRAIIALEKEPEFNKIERILILELKLDQLIKETEVLILVKGLLKHREELKKEMKKIFELKNNLTIEGYYKYICAIEKIKFNLEQKIEKISKSKTILFKEDIIGDYLYNIKKEINQANCTSLNERISEFFEIVDFFKNKKGFDGVNTNYKFFENTIANNLFYINLIKVIKRISNAENNLENILIEYEAIGETDIEGKAIVLNKCIQLLSQSKICYKELELFERNLLNDDLLNLREGLTSFLMSFIARKNEVRLQFNGIFYNKNFGELPNSTVQVNYNNNDLELFSHLVKRFENKKIGSKNKEILLNMIKPNILSKITTELEFLSENTVEVNIKYITNTIDFLESKREYVIELGQKEDWLVGKMDSVIIFYKMVEKLLFQNNCSKIILKDFVN